MIDPEDDVVVEDTEQGAAPSGSGSGSSGSGSGSGASDPAVQAAEWESLKRRCRAAEAAVDAKLAAYTKLAAQLARWHQSQPPTSAASAGGNRKTQVISDAAKLQQQHAFVSGGGALVWTEQATTVQKELEGLLSSVGAPLSLPLLLHFCVSYISCLVFFFPPQTQPQTNSSQKRWRG